MKWHVKRQHPHHHGQGAPVSPDGQPGKRTLGKASTTGTSGGMPTPTPIKHPAIDPQRPDDAHEFGQPHPDDPVFREVGPAKHPTMNRGNKPESTSTGGRGHADVSVIRDSRAAPTSSMSGSRPMTVKHMIRQKTGSSHSARMRKEGQHMHERGPLHGHDGKTEKPFMERGKHIRPPGQPEVAGGAKISDHLADHEAKNFPGLPKGLAGGFRTYEATQPRVAKFGSTERFKRLMMTRKRDKGGAA